MGSINNNLFHYSQGSNSAHLAELKISKGLIPGHSVGFKFGSNPTVGAMAFETVWENGGDYVVPSTATTATVVSSSVNDTAAGTGARTIVLSGLDADYNPQEETVTMNGTTNVVSTNTWIRLNRAYVLTAGSLEQIDGTITVTVDGKTVATLIGPNNQTEIAHYTVPAGYTMYLYQFQFSVGQGKDVEVKLVSRRQGSVYRTVSTLKLYQNVTGFPITIPLPLPEKSDFQIRAKSSSGTVDVSATFGYVLVKNSEADV